MQIYPIDNCTAHPGPDVLRSNDGLMRIPPS